MRLSVELGPDNTIDIVSMKQEQLAVVIEDKSSKGLGMVGEVIYRGISGWHGLTGGRWWPSAYVLRQQGKGRSEYLPELRVRILTSKDVLKVAGE